MCAVLHNGRRLNHLTTLEFNEHLTVSAFDNLFRYSRVETFTAQLNNQILLFSMLSRLLIDGW